MLASLVLALAHAQVQANVAAASAASTGVAADDTSQVARPGHVILGLRRLFPPVSYARDVQEGSRDEDRIAWGSAPSHLDSFGLPRLGLDVVVAPHVSVGIDLFGVASIGGDTPATRTSALGVAARGGAILPLGPVAFVWLTGGLEEVAQWDASGTHDSSGDTTIRARYNQIGVVAEGHLVITPVRGFGITAGAASDLPIYGRFVTETTSRGATLDTHGDAASIRLAATTGVLAIF